MSQLKELFPKNIQTYYDVFCGGGSASINVEAKRYVMNDIDLRVIELHQYLQSQSEDIDCFIKKCTVLLNTMG
jgi:Site-specific DNA methylase